MLPTPTLPAASIGHTLKLYRVFASKPGTVSVMLLPDTCGFSLPCVPVMHLGLGGLLPALYTTM
jgi:hypothetical protein